MIVEMAGLPGSGKSSIARCLSGQEGSTRSLTLVRSSFAALARRPGVASRALRGLGVLHLGAGWPGWLSLCVRRLAQDQIHGAPGTTSLLVEGVVHHTWRELFIHPGLRARRWNALVEAGPPLLVLLASSATRHTRVAGKPHRGPVNRQLASGVPGDSTWQRAEAVFDEVLTSAGRRRQVLRVTTEGDLDAAVRRVREAIESLA